MAKGPKLDSKLPWSMDARVVLLFSSFSGIFIGEIHLITKVKERPWSRELSEISQ